MLSGSRRRQANDTHECLICTGIGPAADRVIDCEVRDCVAAGFNISSGDVLERCRADAKFSEALSCPYPGSRDARVKLEILDSRGGLANELLATINGRGHSIVLRNANPDFVPADLVIALGTRRGHAFHQRSVGPPRQIQLANGTPANVVHDTGPASGDDGGEPPVSGSDPRN